MIDKVPEIVLGGGPCSGKTTGLNYFVEKFSDYGFRVFTVPEAATMMILGGVRDIGLVAKDFKKYYALEERLLTLQRTLRKEFNKLAKIFPDEKRVIIFDRAEMDIMAYIGEPYFKAMLDAHKLNFYDVRDSYDGVIHLVTAASGAEEFYSAENNAARRETLEEARIADEKTKNAWVGHPHLRVIDNSTGFELKMKRSLQAAARFLGIPVPLEIERKFLLKNCPDINDLPPHQEIKIEQIYLNSPEEEEIRIRKRAQNGSNTYYKTRKIRVSARTRQETENVISAKEYLDFQTMKDPQKAIIEKLRYCFFYKNQYFELDVFIKPKVVKNLCLLEIELTEENDKVEIPTFLEVKKEVTDDFNYSNSNLAKLFPLLK